MFVNAVPLKLTVLLLASVGRSGDRIKSNFELSDQNACSVPVLSFQFKRKSILSV